MEKSEVVQNEENKEELKNGPNKEFTEILNNEKFILDNITAKQIDLRKVVTKKDWDAFVPLINELNSLADRFQQVDTKRDKIQASMSREALEPYKELLASLRDKLLKCKIETKVIEVYVSTTREFISTVVQEAIPRERNKNYTKQGKITDARKSSILLDLEG